MVWLISGPLGGAVIFLVAFFCTRVRLGLVRESLLGGSRLPDLGTKSFLKG